MAISLDTVICKVAPSLSAAYEYASTLNEPCNVVPTAQGYVIVEGALPNGGKRRTTEKELNRVRANAKQIFCPETNQTYSCLREAAQKTGASYQNISAVLHNRIKTTKGLHFTYSSELDEILTNEEVEY